MFINPAATLAACNIRPTDTVADFGAGSGHVAQTIAKLVPRGNVFAIEIKRDMVDRITKEVKELHIENMHPLWGDVEIVGGTKLGNESVDVVILANLLFQLDDKKGCIQEAYRILKPNGRLVLIEWSESYGGMGPAAHHVVSKEKAEALFAQGNLKKLSDTIPAGAHHYGILFEKS